MRVVLRNTLLFTLYSLGIHHLFRLRQRNKLTILLYHGVAPRIDSGIFNYRKKFLSPKGFEKHVAYLKKKYSVIDIDTAVKALISKTPLPPYPLAITFDDGYKNALEFVLPILKTHDARATIFLVTNFIDAKIPLWVDRLEYVIGNGKRFSSLNTDEKKHLDAKTREHMKTLPNDERETALLQMESENNIALSNFEDESSALYAPLSWEDIKSMQGGPMSFGAHTQSHPILAKVSDEVACREVSGSLKTLRNHVKQPSEIFAYPNGRLADFTSSTETLVREAECVGALTTIPGLNTAKCNFFALKRFSMDDTESVISFTLRITGVHAYLQSILKR